jgi:cytochrome c553
MLRHGAALSSRGIRAREIPVCENCHAADAAGLPPAVPYLQGQYAAYIADQLHAWKEGRRTNDEGGVMSAVAQKMTDYDIEAVALYLESLRPLGPGVAEVAR